MSYKFLNLDGLERFFKKVKGIIPTKTSELQNDSGFITAQGTYDDELSDTSEKAVQNKVVKQALDTKADDSSVVHTTGNESISGVKTFTSDIPLRLKTEDVEISTIPSATSDNAIRFTDKNNTIIADVKYSQFSSGNSEFGLNLRAKDTNGNTISKSVALNTDQNGTWHNFRPSGDSEIGLGSANYKWKSVYADNYYKGTTAFGDIITHNTSEFADASHTHTASDVSGLSTVATSGSYNDLSNKPTIPTVNNATLTIQKNGATVETFTANASSNVTCDISVPTKTSDLTNDSGFLTSHNPVDSDLSSTSENAVQNKVVKQALDGKSDDSSVVHTTGNESISGTKSFNSDLNLNYASTDVDDIIDSIPGLGTADDYVHISGNETVNGVKSFPDGIVANVSGTATPLAHTHTKSEITDFSHTHGSITNDGKLGTTANKPLITGANGVISTGSFGTSANTFCQGNDSRLSDARTPLSHTHGNSDITSLDASKITSGTIDIARLPKGALERLVTVADQTARFALTSNDVQLGDTVKQLDTGVMYIVSDESKLNSADGYTEYTAGSATSVPWSGVTGKPSSYTPSSHSHGNIANGGTLGTASRALITDGNKKITTSSVTSTELGYLSGVTSAIQTQISGKANASHTHSASDITSGLATVATSGSYNDLSNKPTIPTVNNATLTIQKNGTTVKTFTANASSNVTANITVPTKTSELTNDSGYLTSHQDISGLSAKADTIKSLSISGRTITYTKGDDTTGTLTTQDNNTWTAMVGATSSANGSVGYVNAVPPKDGYNTKYLRADGTWAVPPDHTYTVNNKTLTIQKNGTSVATFTANSASDVTANIVVPTKTSNLTNDSHQTITMGTDSTSTASPAHGGTFTCIDSVTKDSNGHVTAVNTKTVTLPSDNNTDTKVTQTASNSNAYYPVLVANTNIANTGTLPTTSTEGVRKSYSLSVNTRYGFLYGRNPYDTDNLKGAVAGGNRASAAMYSLTYDNANVGALELGRVDKYGNRYSRLYAANYITNGALATDGTAISSVLDIGVLSNGLQYISTSGGWYCNVYPCTTNERSLGTSDLKWANVYATTFTGNLTGNVTGNVTGNCSGSSGSCTGNASTATQFSANTTVALTGDATGTSAGSKKGWSVPVTLANSGVTAGTYGPSADVTGNNNATISVPQITVDAKGRVTSVTNRTLTCKNNTYNVYNKTLTIQKNGTNVATFTSNSNTDVTANITVPTKVSELTNDIKYTCSLSGNSINFDWSTQYANKVGIKVDNTWLGGILTTANTTIPTKTSQLTNDSGFLTSHQSLANYVTLNGAQSISGQKIFTVFPAIRNTVFELGATPSSNQYAVLEFFDKNSVQSGYVGRVSYKNGYETLTLSCNNKFSNGAKSTSGSNIYSTFILGLSPDGLAYLNTNAGWASNVWPMTNDTVDLGTASLKWRSLFVGEIHCYNSNAFMSKNGNYTFLIRNDGSNTYFLMSESGGDEGTWSSARPLTIKNSTGICDINGTSEKAKGLDSSASITQNGVTYTGGTIAIGSSAGQLYKGSSNNASLISAPENGTYWSSTAGNVQNLRMSWATDGKYLHDIFVSPNYDYIWHRNVSNGTARGWRRVVEENVSGLTDQTWAINIGGTSANVTGTVAIANGGTGATTRLNAVKALTNEDVGTNAQFFLTITTNWGKAGYCSVANAKTVLGLGSAAYTASTAYAAASHTHSYLPLTGGTVTGDIICTTNFVRRHTSLVKGTNPSSKLYLGLKFCDKNGANTADNALGLVETSVGTDGTVSTYITAFKNTASNNSYASKVSCNYDTTKGWINCVGEELQLASGIRTQGTVPTSNQDCTFKMFDNSSHTMFEIRNRSVANSSNKQTYTTIGVAPNTSGAATTDAFRIYAQTENSSTVCNVLTQNFLPISNNTYALGDNSHKWKTAHAVNFYENGTALSSKYIQINALAGGNAAGSLTHSIGSLVLACCAESALANTRSYANVSGNQLYPCRTEMCTSYDATGYHYVPIVVRNSSDSNLGSGTWRYLGGSGANFNNDVAKIYGMFLRVA